MRVVIVGAGIMGTSSALALADAGADVLLLERAVPGAEASSRAAGMLGAQLEGGAEEELRAFLAAREAYRTFAPSLVERSGVDVGYRVCGALRVARNEAELAALEAVVHAQRAFARAQLLGAAALGELEPSLAPLAGAAYFPDEAQVEPARLLRALSAVVARHPRIVLRSGTTVRAVHVEGGRAAGVVLEDGVLAGDAVVLAAGSWSSLVAGVGDVLPEVKPARGHLLELEERPPRLRHIVAGHGTYLVPRGDGRVVCGTTVELVGFRREVTAGGVDAVLHGALSLAPTLREASFGEAWSSFRPYSTSGAPLVGKTRIAGLVLATGHHRNGILLAPTTAEVVRDVLVREGGGA